MSNLLLAVIAIAQVNHVNPCIPVIRLFFLKRSCRSHVTFEWNLSLLSVNFVLSMSNLHLEIISIHSYEPRVTVASSP